MKPFISIKNITKTYNSISGHDTNALKNITLNIEKDDFISIVGTSGSGKTSLLKLISGIDTPTKGEIIFKRKNSKIGYVFQENTVFPWRTVQNNIGFPLEVNHVTKTIRHDKINNICKLVGLPLEQFLHKYPHELSGGQKRRVAIGMALAFEPEILLLDEPTSQLDDLTKYHIQKTLLSIWRQKGITIILVTHDINEAIFLSEKVVSLKSGIINDVFEIDITRPREFETYKSKEFSKYHTQVFKSL